MTILGGLLFLATAAQAQIAYRAAASASVDAAGTISFVNSGGTANRNGCGSIAPSIPGGSVGDLLIAVVATGDDSTIAMAGWNTLFYKAGSTSEAAALFWRIATGADPNTIIQSGNCNVMIGRIARFSGVDTSQPFQTAPLAASNASFQSAATVTTGTQAVPYADAMVVFTAHTNDDASMGTLTGFTRAFNVSTTSGNDAAIALFYGTPTTTPPYTAGPYSVSKSRGADPNQGVVFALRPAGSTLAVNVPAGTVQNDVMIASLTVRPCSNTSGAACTVNVTAPSGWTLVNTIDQRTGAGTGGFGNRLFIYEKVASAAEPASYTWVFGGTPSHAGAAGSILGFSGVDTTNPIVAEAGQATPSALTHATPAIDTTGVANTMLVATFSDNSAATWTPPGTMAEKVDIASLTVPNDLGLNLEVDTEAFAAGGPVAARTATQSNAATADTGTTHILALRPGLSHYAIAVSATNVATCDYVDVTITGHSASDNAVAPPANRTLTLTTSPATASWQGTLVTGTGGWTPTGSSATYIWPGNETSFSVRLRQYSTGSLNINLNDGSGVKESTTSPAEDPNITFVSSAFRISNGSNTATAIGTQIAGKPSSTGFGAQTLNLQAVNGSGSGACSTLLPTNTDVQVEVAAQCNNPASCTQNATLTSSALTSNTRSFPLDGAFRTMNFRFTTANSEAPFTLSYADAGQITLLFRTQITGSSPATYVQGTSNAFVVRPFGFAFRGINAGSPVSHGTNQTAGVLAAAGDNFTMTLGAYAWANATQDANNDGIPDAGKDITGNALTPNFAAATTVDVDPVLGNLAGAAGTLSRASGAAAIAAAEWSAGKATIADWRYSEVGNVFLRATSNDYLGDANADIAGNSGFDGTGNAGGYVGRFRPKYFVLLTSASPLSPSIVTRSDQTCSGGASTFTYMNETLRLAFKVAAQNAQNQTTTNYNSVYARNAGTFAAWAFGAKSGATDLSSRIDSSGTLSGGWVNGVADITLNTSILRKTPDDPDGPYSALKFGIAPTDADGTVMNTLDLAVGGSNDHKDLGITTDVRFGRLRLANNVGPEIRRLPLSITAEYWNGSGFVTNAADSCTTLRQSDIALTFATGTPPPPLSTCGSHVEADASTPPIAVRFSGGVGTVGLTAPGQNHNGFVGVTANLGTTASGNYCNGTTSTPATAANMPYLFGRWNDAAGPTGDPDSNPNTAYDDNPSARAGFGLYGSQPGNFIYFRERY